MDWLIAEGETDAARLYRPDRRPVRDPRAPTGARRFEREWAAPIPRGASSRCATTPTRTGTPAPSSPRTLLAAAGSCASARRSRAATGATGTASRRSSQARAAAAALRVRAVRRVPGAAAPGRRAAARGARQDVLRGRVAVHRLRRRRAGKTTWAIDGVVHLAAGAAWLGIPVPRPVRVLVIENEGPAELFREKLAPRSTPGAARTRP